MESSCRNAAKSSKKKSGNLLSEVLGELEQIQDVDLSEYYPSSADELDDSKGLRSSDDSKGRRMLDGSKSPSSADDSQGPRFLDHDSQGGSQGDSSEDTVSEEPSSASASKSHTLSEAIGKYSLPFVGEIGLSGVKNMDDLFPDRNRYRFTRIENIATIVGYTMPVDENPGTSDNKYILYIPKDYKGYFKVSV